MKFEVWSSGFEVTLYQANGSNVPVRLILLLFRVVVRRVERETRIQGYLAHKKQPSPLGPP